MIKALLLDLDDTLLVNDLETFGQHYFRALLSKVEGRCSPEAFLHALKDATQAMWHNDGCNGTNAQVFREHFFPQVGCTPEELLPVFEAFYLNEFEALQVYTQPDAYARPLVELAFARGLQVVIATQPLFPLTAILARLRWANAAAEEFPYAFITSYEVMSACKPHPHYFASILERLGRAPQECLMVGDDLQTDMPARDLGLATFWVDRGRTPAPETAPANAWGTLADLIALIETGRIDEL